MASNLPQSISRSCSGLAVLGNQELRAFARKSFVSF
jgi:hypothetical protein